MRKRILAGVLALVLLCSACAQAKIPQTTLGQGEETAFDSQTKDGAQEGVLAGSPAETVPETETGTETEIEEEPWACEVAEIAPVQVYTIDTVNIRTGPSTDYEIFRKVRPRTVMEKNGECADWSRVTIDGGCYFVKTEYIREYTGGIGAGRVIAIDAGHQQKGNSGKEPVGPGASEMKAKVSDGTQGTVTRLPEYELNLEVAKKLRDELEARGYTVYMVRETNDVDISNSERALAAYDAGADIFVRIHANGSNDSSVTGAMTICPTAGNPYIADLYSDSKDLATKILDCMVARTGCRREHVWETDTMSGINWSMIPVTIVEMGYMTNPDEDRKLASDDYQALIALGIADGIDAYYEER